VVVEFRKHYSGYLRNLPHVARLRTELMELNDLESIETRLHRFRDDSPDLQPNGATPPNAP